MMHLATMTILIAITGFVAWGAVLSLVFLFRDGMRDSHTAE